MPRLQVDSFQAVHHKRVSRQDNERAIRQLLPVKAGVFLSQCNAVFFLSGTRHNVLTTHESLKYSLNHCQNPARRWQNHHAPASAQANHCAWKKRAETRSHPKYLHHHSMNNKYHQTARYKAGHHARLNLCIAYSCLLSRQVK